MQVPFPSIDVIFRAMPVDDSYDLCNEKIGRERFKRK
jgi:hypothetical protein